VKTVKARGVVLREYEAGESDKRLVLLCKGLGKLIVYARGARKPKSKFIAAAQLFTYGDFVLADGRQFYAMAQAEVIESFYTLRTDYARLCQAHYIAELTEKTLLSDEPADDLLLLLLKTFSRLNRAALPPQQIRLVFLFRFFRYYGLTPEVTRCCECGRETEAAYFCDEGTICAGCVTQKPRRTLLSPASVQALRHILSSNLSDAFGFRAGEKALTELNNAGKLFWDCHFQIKLQSEEMLGGQ
jgi:DNA repair protein RecO (recombination protein O)